MLITSLMRGLPALMRGGVGHLPVHNPCTVEPPPLPLLANDHVKPYESVFKDGQFVFEGIGFKARYGTQYHLHFSLEILGADVWSESIESQPCGHKEFYIPGETKCRECMPGAVCNGTALDLIKTQTNFWRAHPNTSAFLQCPDWMPEGACLANRTEGECDEGHMGFLCGVCQEGYAGSDCSSCSEDSPLTKLILFTIVYFGIFGYVQRVSGRTGGGVQSDRTAVTGQHLLLDGGP